MRASSYRLWDRNDTWSTSNNERMITIIILLEQREQNFVNTQHLIFGQISPPCGEGGNYIRICNLKHDSGGDKRDPTRPSTMKITENLEIFIGISASRCHESQSNKEKEKKTEKEKDLTLIRPVAAA